jgi:tetratricopeptide (TPR) repeat protein
VRITAQLIDATTGGHLWSERYDRELKDIFALQDEIRQQIVFALKVKLTPEEQARFKNAPTNNLEAYDYFLRGMEQFERFTKEANIQARRMFEKAIELDAQYAAAYALRSSTYVADWVGQWSQDRQILEHALVLAQKALALNDSLPTAYTALGFVHQWKGEHDQAIAAGERAIALDPNNPQGYVPLARFLAQAGRAEEGIAMAKQAMRLNPHYPPQYMQALGFAYHQTWRNEEAIATLKRYLAYNSEHLGVHLMLTCSYSDAGRNEEAQAQAMEVLRINPNFTIEMWKQNQFFKDAAERDRHVNNLRKAGLK